MMMLERLPMNLFATSPAGNRESRPDFSGLWQLNLERSALRGEPPGQLLMKIEHTEPDLVQRILVTRNDGIETCLAFRYDTTGLETTNPLAGETVRSRCRWVGAELLIESWMETKGRVLHFKDYWSVSPDRGTLTMTHRDDDLAGQISVLQKAPPEAGGKFQMHQEP